MVTKRWWYYFNKTSFHNLDVLQMGWDDLPNFPVPAARHQGDGSGDQFGIIEPLLDIYRYFSAAELLSLEVHGRLGMYKEKNKTCKK